MAEATWSSLLDTFTKEMYSGIITPENIPDVPLLDALQKQVDRASFDNNGNVEVLIQTKSGWNAQGVTDGGNLPTAQAAEYVRQTIGIPRILATCGLTEKTFKLLTGGDASWGPLARRTLDDMINGFKVSQNVAAHGNGTGALARVVSIGSYNTPTGGQIITCDNEYWDTGAENTSNIRKDMMVSFWDAGNSGLVADSAGTTQFKVIAVSPGRRSSTAWAATSGTLTVTCASDLAAATNALSDNDWVFLASARAALTTQELPMGMLGIIANNNTGTYDDDLVSPFTTATFQGLARTSYPSLCSDIWHAGDFSSDADHTPSENWDLSIVGDAMEEVVNKGGKTRLIRCHPQMARCMRRLSMSYNSINVVISNTDKNNQAVVGDLLPKSFMEIEGEVIPFAIDRFCPRYVIEGIDTSVVKWAPKGNADFRRDFGPIWGPTRYTRATTVEAGYEWWYELVSERCDWHWRLNDLAII